MLHTALRGTKILDLSRILAGPWCTQNLADLGAEVIKVESVGAGDDTRGWGPPYLDGSDPADGFSAYYLCCNRGKRSIAINFASPQGGELVRRLAREADVVVENYKAGTLARYGLGYDDLRRLNPALIYLSISGFGQSGPMAGQPGYDYVFQGMGGLMSYTGPADGMAGAGPLRSGVAVIDLMSGMYATTAVLAALVQRQATGQGEYIDLALLDVAVALNANQASNYLVSQQVPQRSGNAHPNCAPYEVFACSDGHLILAIGNDEQFRRFCEVAGLQALATDARFAANAGRIRHLAELRPLLTEVLATRTRGDWADALTAAGVPWGPINTLADVFADAQVHHRGLRIECEHPTLGTIPMVRNPLLSQPGATVPKAPPLRGEDTVAVLAELGLPDDEIERLLRDRVVARPAERPAR
ncbi:CaiB/BaiF CoA transferase family protein [Aquabacterium sp. J223]|uniref:CaiB/BaiF CoA transferase family protein n=1 Tax=Aquabacterium sp. J223 TaxID=2898431 RepID=UPI0021ADBB19|nr:CaiB/BaiF CoA-transferase family protein [Aquabacterium sp. J223]UUX97100.1 CoA transferase [Aquabacterium sp. J223]